MLGLTVATVVFGATSLYLWQQLSVERERAAQVEQTTLKLNARIAELENARTQFAQQRTPSVAAYRLETSSPGAVPGTPQSAVAADAQDEAPAPFNPWNGPRREPPAAFKKIVRSQMRASNRQLYSDVGDALGLNKETADKLVNLITDQQTPVFGRPVDGLDPAEARRKQEAEIADLIGPDKVQALQEYQKTLPARQEFSMLADQLEANDAPLTPEQGKKLLAVFVEERSRVPMPTYSGDMDNAEYAKSITTWQDEYSRRVGDEVNQILNPDQLAAFNDIQQWQNEMRHQIAAASTSGGGPRLTGRGGPALNAVLVNGAAVGFTSTAPIQVPAPPPDEQQHKK
jgi:hypothetical protein